MSAQPSILGRAFEADRPGLLNLLQEAREAHNEWVRRMVLKGGRLDILAEVVLGYKVAPKVHGRLIRHQRKNRRRSLSLIFRGAGKTTVGTVVHAIWHVLRNPNVRILLASKTLGNAKSFLAEIKGHFETNEKLREIFGDFVGSDSWGEDAITVRGRTRPFKEPTMFALGIEGAVVSKHFDVIIADDLVSEDNSRTNAQRDKVKTWFYKELMPTLNPPDPDDPEIGQIHLLGTRYHFDDLYGHLQANEYKDCTLIVRAIDENGQSPWPERFSVEHFESLRADLGLIIFNSQYQCDTELMKGQIFRFDDCKEVDPGDIPKDGTIAMGVDLAIKQSKDADRFAIVVVKIDKNGMIWTLDEYAGHLRFGEQTKKIIEFYERWQPTRAGIEVVSYQEGQIHELQDKHPGMRILPVRTSKDKITRAHKLAARFENGHVHFIKGQHNALKEELVLFPGGRWKDRFDAFDIAVMVGSKYRPRRERDREEEPGLF